MGKYNISGTLFFNYGWDVCSADKYGTQNLQAWAKHSFTFNSQGKLIVNNGLPTVIIVNDVYLFLPL